MSKPRKIKLTEGTVLLSGFPKEVADKLEEYISKYKEPTIIIPEGSIISTTLASVTIQQSVPKITLKDKAIGLIEQFPRQFKIVVIGYDLDSNEAVIEEIKDAGSFKQHAVSQFQQELFKRGLI